MRSRLRRLVAGARALVQPKRTERDLDDELGAYLNAAVEEHVARGLTRDQAIRAARRELGSAAAVKDYARDAGWETAFDETWRDIRLACRTLRRNPGFSVVALLTLALGIGGSTAVFTLLDAVLLKPLPVPAPHELVALYELAPDAEPDVSGGTGRYLRFSYPRLERLQAALEGHGTLAGVTRSAPFLVRLPGASANRRARGQLVTSGYFTTLGVRPALGRFIDTADTVAGTEAFVVVASDRYWRQSLGADDGVIGQPLVVNSLALTLIGVAPPAFVGTFTDNEPDLWMPVTLQAPLGYQNNSSSYGTADKSRPWLPQDLIAWLNVFGRIPHRDLALGTTRLQAANQVALFNMTNGFEESQRASARRQSLVIEPFAQGFSGLRGDYSSVLFVLAAIVGIVLLITCVNIASLLLARMARRELDITIRRSLGATTGRLVRQLLTESLIVAAVGGITGTLLGRWGSDVLARQALGAPDTLPAVFAPDARVATFAVAVSMLTALLFGLLPALRAVRSGRSVSLVSTTRDAVSHPFVKSMQPLVVVQIGLSVVVVFAAILFGRTLVNYTHVDPGFAHQGLVAITLDIPASELPSQQLAALPRRLSAAMQALPGVRSAAMSVCGLIENCSYSTNARLAGANEDISVRQNWVGAGYFRTAGVTVLAGREFDLRETAQSSRVAIVTESLARRDFRGDNPVGRRLRVNDTDVEIVGVVRDVRAVSVRAEPVPTIFLSIEQPPPFRILPNRLDIRVTGDAAQALPLLQDAVKRAEPSLVLFSAGTMSSKLTRDLGRERLVAGLAFGFGGLALLLASIGLYGLLSYLVASRRREIGVRMALGAARFQVVGLVMRQGATLAAVGTVAGLAGAAAVTGYLRGMLFEVDPLDPATFLAVILVLIVVAALASYLPARRATKVDPLVALRSE